MDIPPRSTKEELFSKDLMLEVLFFGLTISLMIFIVWKYLMDHNTNLLVARSIIMLLMTLIQNLHVLNCRSEKNSVFMVSLLSNPLVIVTIIGSILLQVTIINISSLSKFLKIAHISFSTIGMTFIFALLIIICRISCVK